MNIHIRSLFRWGRVLNSGPPLPVAAADKPNPPQSDGGPPPRERQASFKRGAISAVDSIALSPFR